MFFVVFVTLVGICVCDERYNYRAEQGNVTLSVQPDNQFVKILGMEGGELWTIEYMQDIHWSTELMVRVVFGDDGGPLDDKNANDTRKNLCAVLEEAIDDPNSSQARYGMPGLLGLTETKCPIPTSTKRLWPYNFPKEFTTHDLGSGDIYYQMRVENANQNLNSQPVMELVVNIILTKDNETCAESSSSIPLVPSIIGSLAVVVSFFAF